MRQPDIELQLRTVSICVLCVVLIAAQAWCGSHTAWSGIGPVEVHPKPAPRLRSPHLSETGGTAAGGGEVEISHRVKKVAGATLLTSGLLLCSWGITSWEVSEYQCCPAKNTENVIKIVVGVVLINAGLIYLLGVDD